MRSLGCNTGTDKASPSPRPELNASPTRCPYVANVVAEVQRSTESEIATVCSLQQLAAFGDIVQFVLGITANYRSIR